MRIGIRAKMVGTLLLAGLLPLALALGVILFGFVENRLSSKGRMYRALAKERAAHLSTILSTQVELIEMINALPGSAELLERSNALPPLTTEQINQIERAWPATREDEGLVRDILATPLSVRWQVVQKRESRFAEVMVTDATGRLVAASNKTSDYFQADEEWWQVCYAEGKGKVTISDVLFDESAIGPKKQGVLVINICIPLYSPKGPERRVIGVAKASLMATWLQAQLEIPHGSDEIPHAIWLAGADGRALRGAETDPPVATLPAHFLQSIRSRPQGWAVEDQMPGSELVGFAAMERGRHIDAHQQQWYVIVAAGRAEVLAPVYRLALVILVLGLGVIALCFIGGWFIAQRCLIRPVLALEDAVDQMKSGHRDHRLSESRSGGSVFRDDELGRLAHDFNVMAAQLQSNLQRLEQADAVKRQFIDLASHELRTPITYILGVAQLGQRLGGNGHGCGDGNGNGHDEILSRIAAKAHRLTRIVENMFKLLANDYFDRQLRIGPVDLEDTIRAVCQEHDPFLLERRQKWELDLAEDVPPIEGDPDKIRDILANLVSNAIRFSPDESTVRIALHRADGSAEVTISDAGPGIATTDVPKLFEPFFTGAGLRQSSGDFQFMTRGIGLGLSVVKRFVELHRGAVLVDTSSKGTTVRVRLPLMQAHEVAAGK